MNWVLE